MVRSVPVRSIFWLVVCFQISNQKYCLLLKELNKFSFHQLVWGCVCRPELIGAPIQPSDFFFFLMYCLLAWTVLGSTGHWYYPTVTAISPINMPFHLPSSLPITYKSERLHIYPSLKPYLPLHPGQWHLTVTLGSDHLQPRKATHLTFSTGDMSGRGGSKAIPGSKRLRSKKLRMDSESRRLSED